jgi:hypothetical protein
LTYEEDFKARISRLFSTLNSVIAVIVDGEISFVIDPQEVFTLSVVNDSDFVGVGFGWVSGIEGEDYERCCCKTGAKG